MKCELKSKLKYARLLIKRITQIRLFLQMSTFFENRKEKLTNSEIYNLITNIRSSKPEIRKLSIDSIPVICQRLGVKRSNSEFFPYLLNTTNFTEFEWTNVVKNFAQIDFSDFPLSDLTTFFTQTEFISEIDSKTVRHSYTDLIHFFYLMEIPGIQDFIFEYVIKFLNAEWQPTQLTGLLVIPKIFNQLSVNAQKSLFDSLLEFHESENINARILYIKACTSIISHLDEAESDNIFETILSLLEDPSTFVINEIPVFLVNYAQIFSKVQEIINPMNSLVNYTNWRIRFSSIYSLKSLFQNVSVPFDVFYPFLESASRDSENEIRIAVCELLPSVLRMKNVDSKKLQGLINSLIKDTNHHCRTSIASSLPLFANCLGYEFVTSHLLDLIPDSSREVKLAAIDSLKSKEIARVTALECILTLIKSKHQYLWREKQNIVDIIPSFIETKSEKAQDTPHFIELIKLLLNDGADNVRMEMIKIFPLLRKELGNEWFQNRIYPIIEAASKDLDYQIRGTAVKTIITCNIYDDFGLRIISDAAQDEVSNVRLIVAKYIPRSYKTILEQLQKDSDPDVSELAQTS